MRVGWVGVGKMGLPMASHLLQAGHEVTACDALPGHVAAIAARGARTAESPAAAAAGAEVTFSSIPNDDALRAIALGTDGVMTGAQPGTIFVDTSTVSPSVSAEVAGAARARGVHYLRVAVSGNNHMAERAALTVIASGEQAIFERIRPLLACFGPNQFYVGHAEQARTLKLVINLMIYATGAMLSEALALGRKGGLEWAQMLEVIAASAVGSPIVKTKSQDLARRDFTATFTCEQARKDLDLILGAGKASGVPLPVSAIVSQLNTGCIAAGDADEDYIATVKLLERLAGLPTDRV